MVIVALRVVFWCSLLVVFGLYPLAAWLVLRLRPSESRTRWFALVNVVGAYLTCFATLAFTPYISPLLHLAWMVALAFTVYLVFLLVEFVLLRRSRTTARRGVAALWFPVTALIVIKYVPFIQNAFHTSLRSVSIAHVSALFLGISYMTFRLCYLVQEVRNEVVEMPSLAEYLSFCFFVPTLTLGPINPYSRFIQSYRKLDRNNTPVNRSLLRIIVGLTKYFFLATLINQYTYAGLLLDEHPHHWIDLPIAVFAYTLYLYCNFSGFCDMVIGVSGLLGISVMENFNRPFSARNFQEFWNRWHISLSAWLREMMFTPLVKILVRRFGPGSANHAIAISICVVFVAIGIWHGVGVNFALFGLSQGIGVAVVHYYTVFLKKKLGKKGYAAYRDNKLIHAVAVTMTFVYFSMSLFLFANNWQDIHTIYKLFRP